jgi:hypothetical protein
MRVNYIKNVASPSKKKYCPICILSAREVPMVYNEEERTYKCNYCNYVLRRNMDAVGKPVLQAGNDPGTNVPYSKSVSFTRKIDVKPDSDTYNNPQEAWNK